MSYANFKDPLGLLKRMLLSGNKVAYSVLRRELLSKVMTPLDYMLQGREKRLLRRSSSESSKPVILILGGSRSGTTLLYQTLAYHLPVSYISNFIAVFRRSPIAAFRLFHRFIPRANKNYQNYFGSVAGLGGPNDAFSIWNRWLGEDRNHVPSDISHQSKSEMKNFLNTWLAVSKKPFLNKNNRNSLCAPMFASIFDNVFFIEIYRNPIFVAQSLVLSRRAVQGNAKIGWGLLSKNSSEDNDDPMAYIDDICEQVHQVNQILAKGREKIDPEKYIRVSYEDFCENPGDLIQIVGLKVLNLTIDFTDLAHLQFSTASNQQRLNNEEFGRIRSYFEKLNKRNTVQNTVT